MLHTTTTDLGGEVAKHRLQILVILLHCIDILVIYISRIKIINDSVCVTGPQELSQTLLGTVVQFSGDVVATSAQ